MKAQGNEKWVRVRPCPPESSGRKFNSVMLLAGACAAGYAANSFAATGRTWAPSPVTPGTYNWTTAGNWTGGVPDTNAEIAAFGNVLTTGSWTVDLTTPISLGGITTSSAANTSVVLNLTGSKITLNDDTASATNVNFSYGTGSALSIANALEFADANGVSVGVTRATAFSGALSGANAVSLTSGGEVTLSNNGNTHSGLWTLSASTPLVTASTAMGTATYRLTGATGASTNSALKFSNTSSFSSSRTINDTGAWSPNLTTSAGSGGLQVIGGVTATLSDLQIGGTAGNTYVQLGRNSGSGNANYQVTNAWSPNANIHLRDANLELANATGVQTMSGAIITPATSSATLSRTGAGGTTILTQSSNLSTTVTVSGGTLLVNNPATNVTSLAVTPTNGSRQVSATTTGLVSGQAVLNAGGSGVTAGLIVTSVTSGSFTTQTTAGSSTGGTVTLTANSATGTGAVSVSGSGTKLGGSGLISPGSTNGVTIGNGSILSPGGNASGDTIGTLSLNSANTTGALLTLSSGATLDFQLGASLTSDKLNLWNYAGATDLARNSNTISITGTGVTAGTYNLINTFSDAGATATATGFSSGLSVSLAPALASLYSASLDYSTLGQVNLVLSNLATSTISLTNSAAPANLADTTNASDSSPANIGGANPAVHITGSGNKYISEIDDLTSDLSAGGANVDLTVNNPVYALLWLTDTNLSGGTTIANLLSNLVTGQGSGDYNVIATGTDQWNDLQTHYAGFNALIRFGHGVTTGGSLQWDFAANSDIVMNKVAIVPEPGSVAGIALVAGSAMVGRRRRSAHKN